MRSRTTNPIHYALVVLALVFVIVDFAVRGAGWASIVVFVILLVDFALRLLGVYRT